jgi:hypothetical protein
MNAQRRYLFEDTRYPKIFRHCRSWGHHYHDPNNYPHFIINNRNQFVEDYRIKCYYRRMPKYVSHASGQYSDYNTHRYDTQVYDHLEYYKTIDNRYVVVISPYWLSEENRQKLIEIGWTPYNNMYRDDNCSTMVFVIPMRRR